MDQHERGEGVHPPDPLEQFRIDVLVGQRELGERVRAVSEHFQTLGEGLGLSPPPPSRDDHS